jgi:selenocysteine-specific elongation factor
MKNVVVGTAGHIDHGKTALVKALTGIDADRLKEEKERGITIDLGFADLSLGEVHLGFVDVPGHERFVKNMLAGAHGIDLALLVIAADEGVMPQTREHFEICRLLKIPAGFVVITKIDLVDDDLRQLVEAEVSDFVAGSFLAAESPMLVSSSTGQGIEELKEKLVQVARKIPDRNPKAVTRLPIDRVFTIKGFGTVITGTLVAGHVRAGDELELQPPGTRKIRVRGVQVHGHALPEASAGERVALNLQGLDASEAVRGQALVAPDRLSAGSMMDVRLELIPSAPRPLRTRSRVRLHLGTAEVLARVVLLTRLGVNALPAGGTAYAQLRLESPLMALPGDRFIIRSYSPASTIGGGVVIDSHPAKHRPADRTRAGELLELMWNTPDEVERMALLIEKAGELGLSEDEIAERTGATDDEIRLRAERLVATSRVIRVAADPMLYVARAAVENLGKGILSTLKEFHTRSPLERGMGREEMRERLFSRSRPQLFRGVIDALAARSSIVVEKDSLRLASHRVELSPEDVAARQHLAGIFELAGLQPISFDQAVARAGTQFAIDEQRARKFAQMLLTSGELVRIADLVFHRRPLDDLRVVLTRYKAERGSRIDVSSFKELTGVSRKFAIPLLEHLDRLRVTRRVGDAREIL